jgi:hypothetical protein
MQELFYVSASSSLTLIKENGEASVWDNISNLVISSSAEQIIAYSGSTALVYFPLENTNLYYTTPYPTLTAFYPYNIPTASADTSSFPANINIQIALDENVPDIIKANSQLYFYSGSTYYVSESSVNTSYFSGFSVPPNETYTLVLSSSGAFLAYMSANNPQVQSTTNTSVFQTSSVNKDISIQFTPSANTSYDILYIITENSTISASVISWSFSTNIPSTLLTQSGCTIYDTIDNLYYVSHSGINASNSFGTVAGNIMSASLFGWATASLYYTASMNINNVTTGGFTPIFSGFGNTAPLNFSFTASDANIYQVTMSLTYSGSLYDKYAEAIG